MEQYLPLSGREVIAQFVGPLTIWWGDTAPSLDFVFAYDSGGYVNLAPGGRILVTVALAQAHLKDEPVVRGLPLPPAMATMIANAGIGEVVVPVDDTAGFKKTDSIEIGTGGLNKETRVVDTIGGGTVAVITVYISKFRGTKNVLTGAVTIMYASKGAARYRFPAVPLPPGLYEGQCKLDFGDGQVQRSQRFLFEVVIGTP